MKQIKQPFFAYLTVFASLIANNANSQTLSGDNLNINMISTSPQGVKVSTVAPPSSTTSPAIVNLFEGWQGGSLFGSAPPPKLVFSVNNYGNTLIGGNLRIGEKAASGIYSNYKLSVDGDMIAKRCVIQINSWADFVFEDNYELPALTEVETFINKNKHLPGVPNGMEIIDKGIEVGEINKIMMQKIEELTLYIIEQDRRINELENKVIHH